MDDIVAQALLELASGMPVMGILIWRLLIADERIDRLQEEILSERSGGHDD